ncbi:MAG: hypothetical protein Q8R43_02255 [Alphaproteobacteria bacterium]|nr:hypothetical protein [Alphaproteobacteria bacterium]
MKMLAQTKDTQLNKFTLFPLQELPHTVADLLDKIGSRQSILYKLLSSTLSLPEKELSISLKMFLDESANRLRFFMLTFDEIVVQASLLRNYDIPLIKNLFLSLPSFFSTSNALREIFSVISILCDMFTQLKNNIENSGMPTFLKDFIQKSIIFYKQTHVVLNGYLRTLKVKKSDTR